MSARTARALARRLLSSEAAAAGSLGSASSAASRKLTESFPREVVDDIYRCSFKRQTGVSLKCVRPPLSPVYSSLAWVTLYNSATDSRLCCLLFPWVRVWHGRVLYT